MPKPLSSADVEKFQATFCDIALTLIEENGIDNTSLRSIAKAYGCSSMTPYRYFKDKEELLDIIRARGFKTFIDRLDAITESDFPAMEKMHELAREYFEFALEKHTLYQLMFDRNAYNQTTHPQLQDQLDRLNKAWASSARVSSDAGVNRVDGELAAQLFWAGMHGLVTLHISQSFNSKWSFEQMATELIDTMFLGFA
ncbi:Fatty acid metabolism regulator protein [BD1-7 clade bacterium]|uniref:Fatty acid metabolism regulator protein n=1 Tax=BD1-7 clade bacterium TaxID=2029982 RepID=A0A5S9QZ16_9GAMM|nr:Fatty acid metabolism regulator protein [BD1-7 clade bacterium]